MDNNEHNATSKKSKTEGVEENTKSRCAKWDDYTHIKFVELCEEEIRKGNRPGSYLSKDGWRNLIAVFNQMTGRNYDKKQMKNHWNTMKSEWKLFKSLTHEETGLGFDAKRNTIAVDDEWWEKKITQYNRYKKFRNKDLSLFLYQYDTIFSVILALRHRARAPNQTYPPNQSLKNGIDLLLVDINEVKRDMNLFTATFNAKEKESSSKTRKKIMAFDATGLKEDIQSLLKLMFTTAHLHFLPAAKMVQLLLSVLIY
ncbi:Myb/SANT-like domain [Dillenia turbinata]|uniref:Myb/SANT-like domain n=1 Tax=Dillenia turbinata TaxID=194707 RepID=A0AAN8VI72_9MAGN